MKVSVSFYRYNSHTATMSLMKQQTRRGHAKAKDANGNMMKGGSKSILNSSSQQKDLVGLPPLFFLVSVTFRFNTKETDSGTVKECLLGNGSCAFHQTSTSPELL